MGQRKKLIETVRNIFKDKPTAAKSAVASGKKQLDDLSNRLKQMGYKPNSAAYKKVFKENRNKVPGKWNIKPVKAPNAKPASGNMAKGRSKSKTSEINGRMRNTSGDVAPKSVGKDVIVRPKGELVSKPKGIGKDVVKKQPGKSVAKKPSEEIKRYRGLKPKKNNKTNRNALKMIAQTIVNDSEFGPKPKPESKSKSGSKPKKSGTKKASSTPKPTYDLGQGVAVASTPRPGLATVDPLNIFGNKNGVNPFSTDERLAYGYAAPAVQDLFAADMGASRENLNPLEAANAAMSPADALAFDRMQAEANGYLPEFQAQQAAFAQPAAQVVPEPVMAASSPFIGGQPAPMAQPVPAAPMPTANRLQQKYVPQAQLESDAAKLYANTEAVDLF